MQDNHDRSSLHTKYPGFEVCIRQLFSDDPLEYEDAYHWLTDWRDPRVSRQIGVFPASLL